MLRHTIENKQHEQRLYIWTHAISDQIRLGCCFQNLVPDGLHGWLLASEKYGPRHAKAYLQAYADSEGPDQHAHPHSPIRAFAAHKQTRWIYYRMFQRRANAWMRLCVWIPTICTGLFEDALSLDASYMISDNIAVCYSFIMSNKVLVVYMNSTLSPLSFWNRRFHLWMWTHLLFQIGVWVKNQYYDMLKIVIKNPYWV